VQVTTEPVPVAVDVGPTVVSLLDIVWTSILALLGGVITWAVATLRPVLQSFLSAAVIDMAAKRIEAAARRAVEDVLGELRAKAGAGDLKVAIGSAQIAEVASYLLAQVPTWLRLAGMDRTAVERFVARLFGQEVARGAPVVVEPTISVGEVQDAVRTAVRDAVADPASPLTVAPAGSFGGLGRG
jgi:hypothetical protein